MREYLREWRHDHNQSIKQIADMLGITEQGYWAIETGKRQTDMTLSVILSLSEILGITVEQMIDLERNYLASRESA